MGNVEFGIPRDLVAGLARSQGIRVAIETGTFQGKSAQALQQIFDRVWSIELSPEIHQAAKSRLGHLDGLTFLNGQSSDVMPDLIASLDEPILYWLDGHWCEGAGPSEIKQCPILDEIEIVDQHPHAANSCILIDDAQFHLAAPPPPYRKDEWPSLVEVVDALRARHDRFFTVLDDVLIAGPPSIRDVVDAWWLGHHHYENVRSEREELKGKLGRAVRVPGGDVTKQLVRKLLPESLRKRVRASGEIPQ